MKVLLAYLSFIHKTVAAIAGGKSASIHCHHTIKRADRF